MTKKDWHGSVFERDGRLVLKVKDASGEWKQLTTPLRVGQEQEAEALLKQLVKRAKSASVFAESTGQITVKSFAAKWIETRHKLTSWKDDESRLRQHILPAIGSTVLRNVTTKDLRDMVRALERKTVNRKIRRGKDLVASEVLLSAKTIRNVYGTCVSLFRDAAVEGLIATSPCILASEHLPSDKDQDDDWREDAIFTVREIEMLIGDERLPLDRRVFYAIAFLGCTRFGEGAALRWKRYDADKMSLGPLNVRRSYNTRLKMEKSTKTKRPRVVPVHPALASLLAQWKLSGWHEMMGRAPTEEDLLIPSRLGANRSSGHMLKKFHEDCVRIGIRTRRQHDSRRTWISLARNAGANDLHRRWISHGPSDSVDDGYTTLHWQGLCAVVMAIRITPTPTPSTVVMINQEA